MGFFKQWRGVVAQSESNQSTLAELQEILPELRELCTLRVNLDRLGPRLEILDRFGPRLEILDKIGPRTELIEELVPRINMMDSLGARIDSLEHAVRSLKDLEMIAQAANSVLQKFLDSNHSIAEDVRLDVDTMSALTLSLSKSITDLTALLERQRDGEHSGS